MARIETGRFGEQLRRLLNLKSNEGPSDIAPEMNAVFVLESDRSEWAIHKLERWVRANIVRSAAAGFVGKAQIRNPSGSNVLAVIERLRFAPAGAAMTMIVRLVLKSTDYTTVSGPSAALDTRWYQGGAVAALSPLIRSSQASDAAPDTGSEIFRGTVPTAGIVLEAPVALLSPGYALEVQGETANTAFDVNWLMRERPLTPAERIP